MAVWLVLAALLSWRPAPAQTLSLDAVRELPVTAVDSTVFSKAEVPALARALGVQIGRPIDLRRLDEGVREIHRKGRAQSLFVEAERDGAGVRLVLKGSKIRRLRKVTFRGVETEVLDEVRRRFNFTEGETADTRAFTQLRERLKESCEARGYYFADVSIAVTDAPESNEADVEVSVDLKTPTVIDKITLTGVPDTVAKQLRERITLRRGNRFEKAKLDESVEIINRFLRGNQYPTSRVEDAQTVFSADKSRVEIALAIRLGERYLFLFSGNKVFEERALRSVMTEEVLSQPDSLSRIASSIEAKYRAIGHHFVKVQTLSRIDPVDNLQIVEFRIHEGPKVIIDEVVFSGNTGDLPLERLFIEGAPGVLYRGVYWEEGLPEAVANLKREAQARGYLAALVSEPRSIFSEDRKGARLVIDVDLGTRTSVGEIAIEGVTALTSEQVKEALGIAPGEPLNREKVEEGRRRLIEKLQSEGYIDAKYAAGQDNGGWLELSADRRSATVRVRVEQGPQIRVGKIRIEGNRKTEAEVILREMKLEEGDKFDPVKLRRSEEDIALLGLFSRVEILPADSEGAPGRKDLTVVVRENRPGVGEMGFGGVYEEPRLRLRAFLGAVYRNVGGLNQTLSARGQLSLPISKDRFIPFIEYSTNFGYRAPYVFNLPFIFSTQIGLDSFETSSVGPLIQTRARIEGKLERNFGGGITGIYRLYRYERTRLERLDTGVGTVESLGSTGPGVIVDFRDDIFNPTKGSYHTLDLEISHPTLLSSPNIGFFMGLARNSFYVPLVSPFNFTAFLGLGYAQAFSGYSLPTTRLATDLSLGGQISLRGYDLRSISPYDPNKPLPLRTAFYNVRLELTSYLFANLSAAVFFDTGQIFPDLISQPRKDGIGVGFRYRTPVGPIVIDIAQALRGSSNVKFYFTVGTI